MPKSKTNRVSGAFLDIFVLDMGRRIAEYVKCYKKFFKKGECLCTLM